MTSAFLWIAPWVLLAEPVPRGHVAKGAEAPAYAILDGRGAATLLMHAGTGNKDASITLLTLMPGAAVPEHQHEKSAEILYVQEGSVEMTLEGKALIAGPGDAVYIPANSKHSARVTSRFSTFRAVQIYVGPGPEQRFAAGEKLPAGPGGR